jgi:hypothetical protein
MTRPWPCPRRSWWRLPSNINSDFYCIQLMKNRMLKVILPFATLALSCGVLCLFFFRGLNVPAPMPSPKPVLTKPVPQPESQNPVFSSFGPTNSYIPGSDWAAGTCAHGESFVPARSGTLSLIEVAIERSPETKTGDATVFLAQDKSGFPGPVVERFRVQAAATARSKGPAVLKSIIHPRLQAGVTYWLCAESAGGWGWHINPLGLIRASACEREPNKWISGGNAPGGAFSITVTKELEQIDPPSR